MRGPTDRGDHPGVRGRRPARPLARRRGGRLRRARRRTWRRRSREAPSIPVLPAAAATGLGDGGAARGRRPGLPLAPGAPAARRSTRPDGAPRTPSRATPPAPLVAEVVKTTTDPYVGRISLVRVFSGTLAPDVTVHVSGHSPSSPARSEATPTTTSTSGSGAVSVPRRHAHPGRQGRGGRHLSPSPGWPAPRPATPCPTRRPAVIEPWDMPEPLLPVAHRGRAPAPTRTSWRRRSAGWRRRTRRCGSRSTRTTDQLVVWYDGRGARSRCCSTGSAPGTASRSTTVPGAGGDARDVSGPASGHGPARQAVRRPRAVRGRRHRGRAAARGRRVRVRRQGRRRRGAAPVHPQRREGRPRAAGARASRPGTRWSTSGSRWSAARRTASTPPTPRSRRPARWRCEEAAAAAGRQLLEPIDEVTVVVDDEYVGGGHERPVDAARAG